MTDKDTISMSAGYSFSTEPLLSIIKILLTYYLSEREIYETSYPNQTNLKKNFMVNKWHKQEYSQNTILELNHFTNSHTNVY